MYKKKNAFSLAEVLIALTVIGVVAALSIAVINSEGMRKKHISERFHHTFSQLSDLTTMAGQLSNNFDDWSSDADSLKNLRCTGINDYSICLKTALMSVSSQIKDCSDDDECENVRAAAGDTSASIILPNGAHVAINYSDPQCNTTVDVSSSGLYHNVPACGFFYIDVDGERGSNSATASVADRYKVAIQPTKLVKDDENFNSIGACGNGMVYDYQQKKCVTSDNTCPTTIIGNALYAENIAYQYNGAVCYETRCIDPGYRVGSCPEPCAVGQYRKGGLLASEGGTAVQKECCKPIENSRDFKAIKDDLAGSYCLMKDIDFSGETFLRVINNTEVPFTGKLYGNGHKLHNFKLLASGRDQAGVFYKLDGATIKDLGLDGISASVEYTAGVLAATVGSDVTIDGVYNSTPISVGGTTGYIGGLVGDSPIGKRLKISNSYNIGTITINNTVDGSYVGGILGNYEVTFDNVFNAGSVENNATKVYYGVRLGRDPDDVNAIPNTGSTTSFASIDSSPYPVLKWQCDIYSTGTYSCTNP